MPLKLVTAPAEEPITLVEAKKHLRVQHSDDDTLIMSLIAAARAHAERFLGRALVDQTWDYYLDEFPDDDGAIKVPMPPVIEIVGMFYTDSNGDEQEIAAGDYTVDIASEPARIYMKAGASWPSPDDNALNSVRLRFRSGYQNTDSPPSTAVPEDIKAAIKLILGTLYEHRETVVIGQTAVQLPWAAEQLLRLRRFDLSMA